MAELGVDVVDRDRPALILSRAAGRRRSADRARREGGDHRKRRAAGARGLVGRREHVALVAAQLEAEHVELQAGDHVDAVLRAPPGLLRGRHRELAVNFGARGHRVVDVLVGEQQPARDRAERGIEPLAREDRVHLRRRSGETEIDRFDQVANVIAEKIEAESRAPRRRRVLRANLD